MKSRKEYNHSELSEVVIDQWVCQAIRQHLQQVSAQFLEGSLFW
jgi:hypothetical protein